MTNGIWSRGLTAAAGMMMLAPSAAVAQEPTAAQIQALIDKIAATVRLVPASSNAGAYQGQIAATIDAAAVPCEIVQRALAAPWTWSPDPAQRALQRLRVVFQRCASGGTGAVGGTGSAIAGAPGFSVGGGSANYIR